MSRNSLHKSIFAVYIALVGNITITILKGLVGVLSGSASMLAECAHSVTDVANQIILLAGSKAKKRQADIVHQFGYATSEYVSAFFVMFMIIVAGGFYAIYEGISKITKPHPVDHMFLVFLVIGISIIIEGISLIATLRIVRMEIKKANCLTNNIKFDPVNIVKFVMQTKDQNLIVLVLEDSVAIVSLIVALMANIFAKVSGSGIADGIGSLIIGGLLFFAGIILGREVLSLIMGEGVDRKSARKIKELVVRDGIDKILEMRTMHLNRNDVIIALRVSVNEQESSDTVNNAIENAKARIDEEMPFHCYTFIEPAGYDKQDEIELEEK